MADFTTDVLPSAPTSAPEDVLPTGPTQGPMGVDATTAENRAQKYNFALGKSSPGPDALKFSLMAGQENLERTRASINAQKELIATREDRVKAYLASRDKNQPIDERAIQDLQGIAFGQAPNPQTIFEQQYAKGLVQETVAKTPVARTADEVDAREKAAIEDRGEQLIIGKELAQRKLEDLEADWKNAGWGEWAGQHLKGFVPGWSWYNQQNVLKNAPTTSFLLGNNLEEQAQYFYLLPADEQIRVLDQAVAELRAKNPLDAMHFVGALANFSSSDKAWGNIQSSVDMASIPGTGAALKLIGRLGTKAATSQYVNAVQGVVAGAGTRTAPPAQILAAGGNLAGAGRQLALDTLRAQAAPVGSEEGLDRIVNKGLSLFNPAQIGGSVNLGAEYSRRLVENLDTSAGTIIKRMLNEPVEIGRLTPRQLDVGAQEAKELFNIQYPHLAQTILDIAPVHGKGNVDYAAIRMGRLDATAFPSEIEAETTAKMFYQLPDYKIKQQGAGFFIEVQKPIDETLPTVRNALEITTKNQTPRSTLNSIMSMMGDYNLRGANYVLPEQLSTEMKVAEYGASWIASTLKEISRPIKKLSNDSKKDLTSFLEGQRMQEDALGQVGRFSNTQMQLEREWSDKFNRLPNYEESLAYWLHRQIYDIHYTLMNLRNYTEKSRLGFEMHSFPGLEGKPSIEGKHLADFPHQRPGDAGILIWDKASEKMPYYRKAYTKQELLDQYITNGYRVIQVSRYGEEALRGSAMASKMPEGKIRYILSKEFDSAPLDYQQIPYRAGGFHDYDFRHYIRQPIIEQHGDVQFYHGDHNIHGAHLEKDATEIASRYDRARVLLAKSIESGSSDRPFRDFVAANLPEDANTIKSRFLKGELSLDHPIVATPADMDVATAHNYRFDRYFVNSKNDPHELYNESIGLSHALERGTPISGVTNVGSRDKPMYNLRAPSMLDPWPALSRAANQMMRGQYIEDVKVKSIEQFIQEFGHLVANRRALEENPVAYLFGQSTPWKTTVSNPQELAAAKDYLRKVREFVGLKSDFTKFADYQQRKVVDSIASGEKGVEWSDWLFNGARSAPDKLRAGLFNAKLLNPLQFIVQVQTLSNVVAFEGLSRSIKATPALIAENFLRRTDRSPEVIQAAAKKMEAFGWKADHFEEAYTGLHRSGFQNVGRETAMLDDYMEPKLISGKMGTFYDASRIFFNEGERAPRIASWFAAYDRWRSANPKAIFDEAAIGEVLQRANLVTGNMSGSSLASFNKTSAGSIMGMFMTYQKNMFEAFWSGKVTSAERARMMLVNTALYGMPAAVGVPLMPWPVGDSIRQGAIESGRNLDETVLGEILNHGIPDMVNAWVTGHHTNFGDRYGPGRFSLAADVIRGDKSAIEMFTGAMGSTVKSMWEIREPFTAAALAAFSDRPDMAPQELFAGIQRLAHEISAWDTASRAVAAYNTGIVWSKNGTPLDKATPLDAVFLAFGLTADRINEIYAQGKIGANESEFRKKLEREHIRPIFAAAAQAGSEGNEEEMKKQLGRLALYYQIGHYRPVDLPGLIERNAKGLETKWELANRRFPYTTPERLEAYMKRLAKERGPE